MFNNVLEWALANMSKFFAGIPAGLTGQCVSLIKRFMKEWGVADWYKPRGDAKDFGDTLVRQGLAFVVASKDRKRGDLVVWRRDGAGRGHAGVLTSRDNVFEENVALAGTKRMWIPLVGWVYASRIDPLAASWRIGTPVFYRLKAYREYTPYKLKYNSNFRQLATTQSKKTRSGSAGSLVAISAFVKGQSTLGSDQWAKTKNGDYIHSSLIRKV